MVRQILYLKDSKIIFEGQQIKGQKGAVSSKKDLPPPISFWIAWRYRQQPFLFNGIQVLHLCCNFAAVPPKKVLLVSYTLVQWPKTKNSISKTKYLPNILFCSKLKLGQIVKVTILKRMFRIGPLYLPALPQNNAGMHFKEKNQAISLSTGTQCKNWRIFLPLRFYVKSISMKPFPESKFRAFL